MQNPCYWPCHIDPATLAWTYTLNPDGRIQRITEPHFTQFDRKFIYDHAGRMMEAYTNTEARGEPPNYFSPNPYKQLYEYDVWGHMTNRFSLFWSSWGLSDGGSYTNNKRQWWTYDASGNVMGTETNQHTYDALSHQVYAKSVEEVGDGSPSHPYEPAIEVTRSYDGMGQSTYRQQITRQNDYQDTEEGPVLMNVYTFVDTKYYLRSSVFGGAVIAELSPDTQGQLVKQQVNIYAAARRIAVSYSTSSDIEYIHDTPTIGSSVRVNAHPTDRWAINDERNPLGAELPNAQPPPSTSGNAGAGRIYQESGNPLDLADGCTVDGIQMSCSQMRRMMENGTLAVSVQYYNGRRWTQSTSPIDRLVGNSFSLWVPGMPLDKDHEEEEKDDGIVRVFTDESKGFWVAFTLEPQKKPPAPFDIEGIKKLVNQALATPDCIEFAKTILDAVTKKDNPVYPANGGLAGVFNAFLNQTKKHDLFVRTMPSGSAGHANPTGNIKKGDAAIFVATGDNPKPEVQLLTDAESTIAELFHLAGEKQYYDDKTLATAVRNSKYAGEADSVIGSKVNIFGPKYAPPKGWTEKNQLWYSVYFHYIQMKHCTVTPNSVKGIR